MAKAVGPLEIAKPLSPLCSLSPQVVRKLEIGDDPLYQDVNGIFKTIKIIDINFTTITCLLFNGSNGHRKIQIAKDDQLNILIINYIQLYHYNN